MKEFGSDFHFVCDCQGKDNTVKDFYPNANCYADGRQALIHLYLTQGWQRLWVPEYFCYDVIASLKQFGLDLAFYHDRPDRHGDDNTLDNIQRSGRFRTTDAVLRVNYYGMRTYRSAEKLSVAAVVEDHTHDLIGGWAIPSTADWCIASLRKTLPIPEGGMLWSPKGLPLPNPPEQSSKNEEIATIRWEAMRLKAAYLAGETVEKEAFRKGFVGTEDCFDTAPICALDKTSQEYLKSFNIREWYERKRENWSILKDIKKDGVSVLCPEDKDCYPFSLVLLFDSPEERERVRKELIAHQVYPTILWNLPVQANEEIVKFSRMMLSIHCDARYTKDEILEMKSIIESII